MWSRKSFSSILTSGLPSGRPRALAETTTTSNEACKVAKNESGSLKTARTSTNNTHVPEHPICGRTWYETSTYKNKLDNSPLNLFMRYPKLPPRSRLATKTQSTHIPRWLDEISDNKPCRPLDCYSRETWPASSLPIYTGYTVGSELVAASRLLGGEMTVNRLW